MSTFADLTAKLHLNISDFASNMQQASSMASKFAANLEGQVNTGLTAPAKSAKFEFKDVARIVQGIMVSKVFYSGLNAIRSATSAVFDFSTELEYAQMVYTNLFGSADLASNFINVLKDFAAVTPFTFQQSEAAAKRLLAYGIQYKNVMFVMRGVMAAATVQGNDAIIEPISRAFGQIYTKGRLMNEEMRQLAEAGIPAYQILQEKLGLTQKQLQNLGKYSIPANTAINALVEGINERFGNVLDQANMTMKGIISNIKDNTLMIMSDVFEPTTETIKAKLRSIGETIANLRSAAETKGRGGVFESIIPKSLQGDMRTLIANFLNFLSIIKELGQAMGRVLKPLFDALVRALNVVLPVINTIIGYIVTVISVITSNAKLMRVLASLIMGAAAAWLVYKMYSLAAAASTAVVWGIINAVRGLIVALNFLVGHPIWSLLIVGVGLLVSLTGLSSRISNSVKGITSGLVSMSGINTSNILLPETKKRTSDLSKFNNALTDTGGAMDNLASKTGKASKAAKSLLGFDEVFKLQNPDKGNVTGTPDIGSIGGGDIPLPTLDTNNMMPDLSTFADNFKTKLLTALGGKAPAISMGIGGLIGAAIGAIIGGPAGVPIGAAIGLLVGWLWGEVVKHLNLSPAEAIAMPIGALIGGAIGLCVAGPAGALIGGAIGMLVGWIVAKVIEKWQEVKDRLKANIGILIGAGILGIVGFIIGGPLGAALGALLGAVGGAVISAIAQNWDKIKEWLNQQWDDWLGRMQGHWCSSIIGIIGLIAGSLVAGPLGGAVGMVAGYLVGTLVDKLVENWPKISAWFSQVGEAISTFFAGIIPTISGAWTTITTDVQTFKDNVVTKFTNLRDEAVDKWTTLKDTVSQKVADLKTDVEAKFETLKTNVSTAALNIKTAVEDKFSTMKETVEGKIITLAQTAATKFQNIYDTLSTKSRAASEAVKGFFSDMATKAGEHVGSFFSTVINGIANSLQSFKNWVSNLWTSVFNKLFGWIDDGIKKLKELFGLSGTVTVRSYSDTSYDRRGHANGGIFNREHVARFAEGNKAEAVIPLENASAMQPFVTAISDGIMQGLMPTIAAMAGGQSGTMGTADGESLRPLYVGTLVADERGLKELYRKMNVIEMSENKRRGR